METPKRKAEEIALVVRLKAREEKALEIAYDRYSAALYGVLFKILKSEEAAADVLQDSFVKIWLNVGRYDPSKGTFFTWMLNIARNAAIDLLRSKGHRNASKGVAIEDATATVNSQVSVSVNTDTLGLREKVDKLSPDHRLMIEMQYFQGFTQSETAEALDMPLGTVKTRTRAALTELRKWVI